MRVLLLAGTGEATRLADELASEDDFEVVMSYAGLVPGVERRPGRVRVGGFGGAAALARYLAEERIEAVIDATHPFADQMPWHAASACAEMGVPRLRLERPGWRRQEGDRWDEVGSVDEASDAIAGARRVFLTIGHREVGPFARHEKTWFLVRSITPPASLPLAHGESLVARGPFTVDGERALLRRHRIDRVVTKDSGGEASGAKLTASRELGVGVVMIRRPASPPGPRAGTVEQATAWLRRRLALNRSCAVEEL